MHHIDISCLHIISIHHISSIYQFIYRFRYPTLFHKDDFFPQYQPSQIVEKPFKKSKKKKQLSAFNTQIPLTNPFTTNLPENFRCHFCCTIAHA